MITRCHDGYAFENIWYCVCQNVMQSKNSNTMYIETHNQPIISKSHAMNTGIPAYLTIIIKITRINLHQHDQTFRNQFIVLYMKTYIATATVKCNTSTIH